MAEWPHSVRPVTLTELPPVDNSKYESKSPMKYAVVYTLVDEDGHTIHDTDYFITKDEAWDRAKELYEMTGLTGAITFREL